LARVIEIDNLHRRWKVLLGNVLIHPSPLTTSIPRGSCSYAAILSAMASAGPHGLQVSESSSAGAPATASMRRTPGEISVFLMSSSASAGNWPL